MPSETILKLLENGKWHYLKDVTVKSRIDQSNVKTVTKFLEKYNFVKLNEAEQKIKIEPSTNRFLKKIRQLENKDTI